MVTDTSQVGILALQGGVAPHREALAHLGVPTYEVTSPSQIDDLTALVLPGGESTTQDLLLSGAGFAKPLAARIDAGLPVLATCAGVILLAHLVPHLGLELTRNAYGAQACSFEAALTVPALGPATYPGVFIRAPRIDTLPVQAHTLARVPDLGHPALVRHQSKLLATFHPELTSDLRIHRYFLAEVAHL